MKSDLPFGQNRFANSAASAKSLPALARRSTITASTFFEANSSSFLSMALRSAAFSESISCSLVGVPAGEGDGVADLAGVGAPLAVGAIEDDGAGDCEEACAASKIETTTGTCQTN